jgi:hypothetical protein
MAAVAVAAGAEEVAVAADLVPSVSALWAPHIRAERCNAERFSLFEPNCKAENNTARRC